MSDTILSGDFTVYYEAENRQKRIEWSGTATGTRTVNELYSALQDLFDELTQLDDGSPMSAQTPTEYTIGIIDTGDDDPWFIDNTTVEHLTGGAVQTASWTRATSTNTGIVTFDYTVGGGTDFVSGDKGKTVTHSVGGDSGTLLHFVTDGSNGTCWIRPDSSAASNDWDSTGTNINVTGGTGASLSQDAAGATGEDLWSNINTIGTIASNTHIYVEQNALLLTASEASTDWWSDGQIDILIKVKEADVEIDEAVVRIFARQQSKTYSHFETDLSSGGRTAIPLSTGTDLDNQYGYRQFTTDAETGSGWSSTDVGTVITDDTDATKQGVITSVTGTGPNYTVQYYLIGDPLTDFVDNDVVEDPGTTKDMTLSGGPTNVNAAAAPATDITITFGASSAYDIDEDETNENYSIVVDLSDETLDTMQQRVKYLTRRGETADLDAGAQTIPGQFYIGTQVILEYSGSVSGGTIDEGNTVTQATSGATGTVTGHDTTNKLITLRSIRGTFNTTNTVTDDTSSGSITPDTRATVITPNTASPFGTYAGGTFFAAQGVVLINVATADQTNYQLTDDDGNVVNPPNKVTVTVANTRDEDRIAIFRTTGGIINKDEYAATVHAVGDATLLAGSSISTDTPGKTQGGTVVLVDTSAGVEYPIRYSSWAGSTFTLANLTGTATAGTSSTALVDTGESFLTTVRVGDIVVVPTRGIGYVLTVTDNENLVITSISGFVSTDAYEINAVPVITTVSDNIYVPILWKYEGTGTDGTPGTESSILTYGSDMSVLVIARNSNSTASATTPMLPYSATATITSTGLTNNIIRSQDTIKT